jgi:DNA-binding NarL/FixJ family response regulator
MPVTKTTILRETRPAAFSRSLSVHLIEAQALFVPTLEEVFADVGLSLLAVSSDVDLHQLLEAQPDVVFVDADYVSEEPLRLVNLLRTLVPNGIICVYTSERSAQWAKACHLAGATAVFSKNARRSEIIGGMRDALGRRTYTDVRLRET